MSMVERKVRKAVPDVLDLIVTPLVTLLVTGILLVFVIMPVAGFASDLLVSALNVIIDSDIQMVRVLSGYVLAALFLPMVLLGLHHGLIPIYAIQLEQMGGVSLFPVLAMAGAGQVGAAIAIYIKARRVNNARMQKTVIGALPAGFLGVGEPLIYGVTLPLGYYSRLGCWIWWCLGYVNWRNSRSMGAIRIGCFTTDANTNHDYEFLYRIGHFIYRWIHHYLLLY